MLRAFVLAALIAAPLPALAQGPVAGQGDATPTATGETTTTVTPADVTAPAGATGPRQAATGDPNRRICRQSATTGSRIASAKVCKTAREWEEQRLAAKAELDRQQRPKGTNF